MKIQFSPISYIKPKNNSQKKHFNFIQYNHNLNFDTVSFTGKTTLTQQIKELPNSAFLSDGLRNYIMDNISQKNIVDLHKEYYAALMYCNTLNEAKKLYPEFLNVVDINDIDLKSFGSQGQQRSAVLSLKLAELELLKNETGEYPVLLLDDVMSELDNKRRSSLLDFLQEKNIQTLITATDKSLFNNSRKNRFFIINNGKVD